MNLTIINGEEQCKGKWTWIKKNKKSILDYVITRKEDLAEVENMYIDENKIVTPYRIDGKSTVYSDHSMMTVKTNLWVENNKPATAMHMSEELFHQKTS